MFVWLLGEVLQDALDVEIDDGLGVGLGLSSGGEAAPAACIEPILAVSGGIDVDGDENHLVVPKLPADGIDTAATLGEGNILQLRDNEPGTQMNGCKALLDLTGKESIVCVFAEESVWAPLAGSINSMAIIKKDLHSCRRCSDGKMKIICGNTYIQEFPLSLYSKSIAMGF